MGRILARPPTETQPGGRLKNLVQEFKQFVMRGNVLDLAVAVIIGAAFGAVVQAFSSGVLMNLIAAVFGQADFNSLVIDVGDGRILYGAFLTAVVNFLIIAFALFVIIKAVSALQRERTEEPAEETPAPSDETLLLTEIRDLLRAQAQPGGGR
jgi:large conductance mechanosensitive channel